MNNDVVGIIVAYFGLEAPDGWLICDGRKISKSENPKYIRLIEHLRDKKIMGTKKFRSKDPDSAKLPNLKDEFLRGISNKRNIGDKQSDMIKRHKHDVTITNSNDYGDSRYYRAGHVKFNTYNYPTSEVGGDETRPRNIAVNYIIKY